MVASLRWAFAFLFYLSFGEINIVVVVVVRTSLLKVTARQYF